MQENIVIVGAGLSGLRAASLLTANGIKCTVLEARDRIGGRALSASVPGKPDLGKFDLGPSWFWPQYEKTIANIVNELKLKTFDQYTEGEMLFEQTLKESPQRYMLPENSNLLSTRFEGGVESFIDAIADTIPPRVFELNTRVTAIRLEKSGDIMVETELADGGRKERSVSRVIFALPPRIVARTIEITPAFAPNLITDLIEKPTWMAGQAKVVVIYERPFWRDVGLSGFVSSRVGPLQEIHDASPETGSYALFGFLGVPAEVRKQLGKDKMLDLIIDQLVRLFGSPAKNVSATLYKDWALDSETAVEEDLEPLRNFPNYGPLSITGNWENKIIFAGTETNAEYGGHLEGALQSAEKAVLEIIHS